MAYHLCGLRFLQKSIRNIATPFIPPYTKNHHNSQLINTSHFDNNSIAIGKGIPCTGASLSGRAKNKLAHAEEHEGAGALFYYFLNAVVALNPAVCVIENVEPYANTASMAVIRSVLSSRGYTLEETILDASDFGCLEKRRRLCVVAHTGNSMIGDVLTNLVSTSVRPANVGEILENIPGDDPRWKSFDYLVEKEIADKAAGKGFARQLITRESESYGTIGRLYAGPLNRSCNTILTLPSPACSLPLSTHEEKAFLSA